MLLSTSPKASDMYIPCCIIFSMLLWRKLVAKRIPESEIFLPIVQSQGSDLGQDLGMNFLWQHVCGHSSHCEYRTYVLSAGPALLLFDFCISFSHSSSIFWVLTFILLGTIFPQFLFTHFSLYLSLRFLSLHFYKYYSAVYVVICAVCTEFYQLVFVFNTEGRSRFFSLPSPFCQSLFSHFFSVRWGSRLKVYCKCTLLKTSPFILYIVSISYVLTFLQEYFSKAKRMGR